MKKRLIAAALFATFLTACGNKNERNYPVIKEKYNMMEHEYTEVVRGNLTPQIQLVVGRDGVKRIEYSELNDELVLDKVFVAVGDKVKKGDILVSFKSPLIKAEKEGYVKKVNDNNLLIEHYNNLMRIDKTLDYRNEIKMLEEDNKIYGMYIKEADDKLALFQIVATEDGTITYVEENLSKGYFSPQNGLIIENTDSSEYSAKLPDNYEFTVGTKYTAYAEEIPYELEISEVLAEEEKIRFKPITDMSSLGAGEQLVIDVSMEEIKDIAYVDSRAVRMGVKPYVIVVDSDGFSSIVEITTGDIVGDYTIIKSGLNGGEKVVLN